MYSSNDVLRFFNLFQGNTLAYGKTVLTGEMKDGKAVSSSSLVHSELTPAVMAQHLKGEISIGVAPLCQDGLCRFGALDIDSYDYSLDNIVRAIYDLDIPLFPCWSKSKKLHLYIFFEGGAYPEDVKDILSQYRDMFFCGKKTEIFPKQMNLKATNTFYSWINLPYFNANDAENHRKLVHKNGVVTDLMAALNEAEEKKLTVDMHKQFLMNMPYADAPPCIRAGIYLRDIGPGERNNWLFSVGAYLRMKDENADIDTLLTEVNNSLDNPIPEKELKSTIISSFNRKTYFYACSAMSRCDKAICRKCEHGIESKKTTGLEFGGMTQILTDPPYYEWTVNGQKMQFWSEREILQQGKFRELCMRQLHLVPRKVNDDIWSKILTRAMQNIEVIQPADEVGDFSPGSMFKELVFNFFSSRRLALNEQQIMMGRVLKDSDNNRYVFTAKALMDFILIKNDFRYFQPAEIQARVEAMGAKRYGVYWSIPITAIPVKEEVKEETHEEF